MQVKDHIDKISWSLADKALFFIYGVVSFFQWKYQATSELGLFALMINMHTWIFVVVDSFALHNVIQFGAKSENRKRVNLYSLIVTTIISLGLSLTIFLIKHPISVLFNEPRITEVASYLPILTLLTIPKAFCTKLIYRDQEMKKLFLTDLAFFGSMTVITLYYIFSYGKITYPLMVLMYTLGTLLSSIYAVILKFKALEFGFGGHIKAGEMYKFSFPYTLYSGLLYIPKQLDILFVQFFFSTSAVGVYFAAKNLFRVFDEALNASFGLVMPTAVKLNANEDKKALHDLMTKSVSFLLVSYLVSIAILEFGGAQLIISFLPAKYHMAIKQFEVLLLAAIPIPLALNTSFIIAQGRSLLLLKYTVIAFVFSMIAYYIVGSIKDATLFPVGYICFSVIYSGLIYSYAYRTYDFKIKSLFRAVGDSKNFIFAYINKKKKS